MQRCGACVLKNSHLKEEHLASDWAGWLQRNGLDSFEAWWNLPLTPVDDGNFDGDGWSTVSFFSKDGKSVYVKRQSSYLCRNFASPLFAVPTAKAEQTKISWYARSGIPALSTVYFGWRKLGTKKQAILVTEALSGFASLDEFYAVPQAISRAEKVALVRAIGTAVRRLHSAGMLHHNLYPKHIFVKQIEGGWQIRFIDLETSRPHFGFVPLKLRDLETLNRRAKWWSKTDRLRFLLAYQNATRIDNNARTLVEGLRKRSKNKSAPRPSFTKRSLAMARSFAAFFGL